MREGGRDREGEGGGREILKNESESLTDVRVLAEIEPVIRRSSDKEMF
jgi:hypothetical protein